MIETTSYANSLLLNKAVEIGNHLISLIDDSKRGPTWETSKLSPRLDPVLPISLASGDSGIILFLIALYEATLNPNYKLSAECAIVRLNEYLANNPCNNYGLYTGRMGIVYCLLQAAHSFKNQKYLVNALQLSRNCNGKFLQSSYIDDSLYNGRAGVLLVLLHLYASTKEKWVLQYIYQYQDIIIQRAKAGRNGIYWNRDSNCIKGPCGFAHGAAGIGFVFLELGNYFASDACNYIAQQAFQYENSYWDVHSRSWPDFTKQISSAELHLTLRNAYNAGDLSFFDATYGNTDWEKGSAGIALSRIRGYELLNKAEYLDNLSNVLDKHIAQATLTESSCTARFCLENGTLLLKAGEILSDEEYRRLAVQLAANSIENFPTNAGDISLLEGITGLGYFYLHITATSKFRSVLYPSFSSTPGNSVHFRCNSSTVEAFIKIISNHFPKTLNAMSSAELSGAFAYFEAESDLTIIGFIHYIKEIIYQTSSSSLKEAFSYESMKLDIAWQVSNNSLLFQREMDTYSTAQKVLGVSEEELMNVNFVLSDEVRIYSSEEDQRLAQTPLETILPEDKFRDFLFAYGQHTMIMFPESESTVREMHMGFYQFLIDQFKQPSTMLTVVTKLTTFFKIQHQNSQRALPQYLLLPNDERFWPLLNDFIIYWIKNMVSIGVLVAKR